MAGCCRRRREPWPAMMGQPLGQAPPSLHRRIAVSTGDGCSTQAHKCCQCLKEAQATATRAATPPESDCAHGRIRLPKSFRATSSSMPVPPVLIREPSLPALTRLRRRSRGGTCRQPLAVRHRRRLPRRRLPRRRLRSGSRPSTWAAPTWAWGLRPGPQAAELQAAGLQATGPQAAGLQGAGPWAPGPQAAGPQNLRGRRCVVAKPEAWKHWRLWVHCLRIGHKARKLVSRQAKHKDFQEQFEAEGNRATGNGSFAEATS